jgi:hypothetical protein
MTGLTKKGSDRDDPIAMRAVFRVDCMLTHAWVRWIVQVYGNAKQNVGTGYLSCVLSSMVDTVSRCPDRKQQGSRIAEKANAWGNAQDMLTSAR